jgi:predicted nucleic acid-binding protein
MRFIDANVLLRYLTGVPQEKAERARELIDGAGGPLYLTETAFAESAWTLDRQKDEYPRELLVDRFVDLFRSTTLEVAGLDRQVLLRALLMCRPNRVVSFGDALIWARVMMDGGELYTFDRDFPGGITVHRLP